MSKPELRVSVKFSTLTNLLYVLGLAGTWVKNQAIYSHKKSDVRELHNRITATMIELREDMKHYDSPQVSKGEGKSGNN